MTELVGKVRLHKRGKWYVFDDLCRGLCNSVINRITYGLNPYRITVILWRGDNPNKPLTKRLSLRRVNGLQHWRYTFGRKDPKRTKGRIVDEMNVFLDEALSDMKVNEVRTDFYLQVVPLY